MGFTRRKSQYKFHDKKNQHATSLTNKNQHATSSMDKTSARDKFHEQDQFHHEKNQSTSFTYIFSKANLTLIHINDRW